MQGRTRRTTGSRGAHSTAGCSLADGGADGDAEPMDATVIADTGHHETGHPDTGHPDTGPEPSLPFVVTA